jgi:hypothetical protein
MPPPARPAAVSGPGALSQRTDGNPAQKLASLPDAKYGEQSAYRDLQQQAPLPTAQGAPSPSSQGQAPSQWRDGGAARDAVVPMSAPTQRPGEPVTAGAAFGPGPGTAALGINPQQVEQQDMGHLSKNMAVYAYLANLPDASPSARLLVNILKAGT